jgi:hypothetical protein
VLLAVPWTTCRRARHGGSSERAVAALQATSFLLSAMVGLSILILTASLAGTRVNEPGIAVPLVAGFLVLCTVCGTAATWPLMAPLARLFQERLPEGSAPEGLDLTGTLPALAVGEIGDRAQDAAAVARGLARDVLRGERITEYRLEEDLATFTRLRDSVEEPLARIDDEPRPGSVVAALSRASEALQRHGLLFDTAAYLRDRNPESSLEPQLAQQVKRLALEISRLVDACDPRGASTAGVRTRWTSLEDRLIALRSDLARACAIGTLPVHLFDATLERLDELRQIGQLVVEGTEALGSAEPTGAPAFPDSSPEPALVPAGAFSAPTG